MAIQIIPRDWEAISAYLDHQLSKQAQSQFEARLANEPELREALESLRRARLVLRSAPRLRAPRNFTLTASMAGVKHGGRAPVGAYPLLRLASMLATLFFVLVTVGSFAIQSNQPAQSVVMRSEIENAQPAPMFGMGGGGGGGSDVPAPAPLATQEEMSVEMENAMVPAESGAIQATPLTKAMATAAPEQLEAFNAPLETTVMDDAPPAAKKPAVTQTGGRTIWSLVGVLQVSLALLALICGAAAFYLRRDPSR